MAARKKAPTIGERVRKRRGNDHISLRSLAKLVGVSFSTIARIERNDERKPYPHTLRKLKKWLDTGEGSDPEVDPVRCLEDRIDALEARISLLEAGDTGVS